MSPEANAILMQSFMKLAFEVAPALPAGYGQGSVATTGILLLMASQEYERGAEVRALENREMRALFARHAARFPALDVELRAAAAETDGSLAISALNAANARLRRLVIALQTAADEDAGSADVRRDIWALLTAAAQRRLVHLPAM